MAYESEQGEENYLERKFSADEPGRSITRGQNIGLRPLVQDQIDAHEFIDNKSHEVTTSLSKTEGSPNRSSLVGQNVYFSTYLYTLFCIPLKIAYHSMSITCTISHILDSDIF